MAKENRSTSPDHHSIDIPENYEFKSERWIIHRVPSKLRKVNESAYTPQLISIGPYHFGKQELEPMERHKTKYYYEFLKRVNKSEQDLKDFVQIRSEKILEIYEEGSINNNNNNNNKAEEYNFEGMMLRDSCFVIELLLRNDDETAKKNDRILKTPWLRKAVKLDLILLENQIPFFFLKELFDFCINNNFEKNPSKTLDEGKEKKSRSIMEVTISFFEEHFLMESSSRANKFTDIEEINHFTDLLRRFWLPREMINDKKTKQGNISDHKYLYSATKLDSAGVTFEPARKEMSLTDVKIFKKPVLKFVPAINCMALKLPELRIETETECLLRNVMAFEQCFCPNEDYICGYVALMDQLIDTKEDVDFLVGKKILTNLLGSSKEAARLFNGLCGQIPRDESHYARLYNELNSFYENKWNVTRAMLNKVYFKDLWTGSSTVVGLFVLLFTITATTRNVLR